MRNTARGIESGGVDRGAFGNADHGGDHIIHGAGDRRSEQHRDQGTEHRGGSGTTAANGDDVFTKRDGRHSLLCGAAGEWWNDAIQWSVSAGTLPAGLSLVAATGVISGTPTTAGTTSFTVQVTDAANNTGTKALSIAVAAAAQPPTVTTTSLSGGTAGTAYSTTLQSSGGTTPYSWSVSAGTLPAGLSLVASTGVISGTPTTAGTTSFTVQVIDAANNTGPRH